MCRKFLNRKYRCK